MSTEPTTAAKLVPLYHYASTDGKLRRISEIEEGSDLPEFSTTEEPPAGKGTPYRRGDAWVLIDLSRRLKSVACYSLDPKTGEYITTELAQESPMEPGVFMLPANATFAEPPEHDDNEAAVFLDGAWSVVTDLRGTPFWDADGNEYVINALGEAMPENALTAPPPPPPPTVDQLAQVLAELRYLHEVGGILIGGHPVNTDRESRSIMVSAATANSEWPISFKRADGTFAEIEEAGLAAINAAVAAHVRRAYEAERVVLDQITANEITEIEDVATAFAAAVTPAT